jgi:peptidoglycan/LPS O-acetylase OafA/YrhL
MNIKNLYRPKYQSHIDGLRAIAVLSVVLFHTFPRLIPGGFIGVDIFFVISGYLITTIIYESLSQGTFSFFEFYLSRIKRIFPALLTVLICCFVLGWFIMLPHEFKQLGKHIAGGVTFISNLLLWSESGYFDNSGETKPLQHLWSLGVEGQFYILWPILLWFSWKLNFNILKITIIATVISFILNVKGINYDRVATFYSTQTRIWELLSGSVLVWLNKKNILSDIQSKIYFGFSRYCLYIKKDIKKENDGRLLTNTFSILGLILLYVSFYRITKDTSFPGKWAVIPVLGTALIILSGPKAWINSKILSNQIVVWFGLISFPLYLWHWPLLSFIRIMEGDVLSRNIRIAVVGISIVLAWLTYKLVEFPIRFGKQNKTKILVLIIIMIIIGFFGYQTYRLDGLGFRKSINKTTQFLEYKKEPIITRESDGSCQKLLAFNPLNSQIICLAKSSTPEILFVGDSHAMALNSAAYLDKFNLNTLLIGVHNCVPFVGYSIRSNYEQNKACDILANHVDNLLGRNKSIKTIILSTRGPFYFTAEDFTGEDIGRKNNFLIKSNNNIKSESQADMFQNGYSKFITRLEKYKLNIIFVLDVPELGQDPSLCFFDRPFRLTDKPLNSCTNSLEKVLSRQSLYRKIVSNLKKAHPNISIYDTLPVFCDKTQCYGIRNEDLLYYDGDHLSILGSILVLKDMRNKGFI